VYGSPLTLPGPVVATAEPPPEDFVAKLRSGVPCVAPLPPPVGGPAPSPPVHLATADFVYVRCPPAAPSLSPVYRGPYEVHKKADKIFVIKIGGRFEAVSVDRISAALLFLLHPLVVATLLAAVAILSTGATSSVLGGHAVEAILLTVNPVNIVYRNPRILMV
jgi:hypothetical protein